MSPGREFRFLIGLRLDRLVLSSTFLTSVVIMLILISFSALMGQSLERIGLLTACLDLIFSKVGLVLHLVEHWYFAATEPIWTD